MNTLLSLLSEKELDSLIITSKEITDIGCCCPRKCGINRETDQTPCGAVASGIRVASFYPHMGEEPPVSGTNGAGNVFVSGCTLGCVFCQNYPFSHFHNGRMYSVEEFAQKLMDLQAKGVHNLNFTTFDHYVLNVLCALSIIRNELRIPISNNCAGYFSEKSLEIAMSICDIFLYDVKYSDESLALRYSAGKTYVEYNRMGIDRFVCADFPWIEENGILKQGVIFRHLVLPNALKNTFDVLDYLASIREKWPHFRLSLMSQYFPAYRSNEFPEINRRLYEDEYGQALSRMEELGFEGWAQDIDGEGGC